jgi:hypothetical protein
MTEIRSEDEVFRAFRLTQCEARDLGDGPLLGGWLRFTTEMLSRDKSGAVVAHLRHQADLAEAMLPPRAERPEPQGHPWRRYRYRMDPAFDDPVKAKNKEVATDVALKSGEALDDAEFFDGDDEILPERLDPQLIAARVRDAVDDVFEKDAQTRRSAELFEAEMIALARDLGSDE